MSRSTLTWLGLGLLAGCGADDPPTFVARELVREVLADENAWEPRSHPADAEPEVGVLAPSLYPSRIPGVISTDLPALFMPPPCDVVFAVTEEDGPVELRAAAGVHLSVPKALAGREPLSVSFHVEVNGDERFSRTIEVAVDQPESERRWHAVTGVDLVPGDEVLLRTRVENGGEGLPAAEVRVGFGPLVLERRTERARTVASPEAPSVLLVVMDTLRADRVGCYAEGKETTPNLDALAERGMLFEEASATSSWTWPSTASILTGLSPEEHGVVGNLESYLAGGLDTLAESMQRRGIATAAFSANPLIVPQKNYDQGFGTFDFSWRFRGSDEIVPQALEWLRENADGRFFLYLHLADPHTPHRPRLQDLARYGVAEPADFPKNPDPERYPDGDGLDMYAGRLLRGELDAAAIPGSHVEWMNAAYDASVATGDHWFGEVLAELEDLGLTENTLVVFTSDHGEELLDHGLLAHGHTVNRELSRVPLVVAGPGVQAGTRVEVPVSNRHLGPSLARVVGARLATVEGFVDLLDAEHLGYSDVLYSTHKGVWGDTKGRSIFGLRTRDWTLHWALPVEGQVAGETRLFASDDEAELIDVSAAQGEIVGDMREAAAARIEAMERRRTTFKTLPATGETTLEHLQHIGYTDSEDDE